MSNRRTGRLGRMIRFFWSLVEVALIAAIVPYVLVLMGRWRFGSARPWEGLELSRMIDQVMVVTSPSGRITDQMLVDLTIRLAISVGWVCVVVLMVSVAVEVGQQLRRGGRPTSPIRGFGWSHTVARSIAGGLLLVMPMQGMVTAWAGPAGSETQLVTSSAAPVANRVSAAEVPPQFLEHHVRPGESLWEIAEDRLGDPLRWKEIWVLNRGNEMVNGRRFEDPHLILPGWLLRLPSDSLSADSWAATPVRANGETTSSSSSVTPAAFQSTVNRQAQEPALPEMFFALPETELLERERTHSGWEMDVAAVGAGELPSDELLSVEAGERDANTWTESPQLSEEESVDAGDLDQTDNQTLSTPGILLRVGSATMLATGVMVAVAARRRQRLRSSTSEMRPVPIDRLLMDRHLADVSISDPFGPSAGGLRADWETDVSEFGDDPIASELQIAHAADRILRLDLVLRIAAVPLVAEHKAIAAVFMSDRGEIEVLATAEVMMDRPWRGSGRRWTMPAQISTDRLLEVARGVDPPCPALIHIGNSPDGREIFVDLEVMGVVSVVPGHGDAEQIETSEAERAVEEVLRAVQLTLQNSIFGQSLELFWVGAQDHEEEIWPGTLGAHEVRSCRGFDGLAQLLERADPQRLQVVVVSGALDLANAPDQLWMSETVVIGKGLVRASGAHLGWANGKWSLKGPVFEGVEIPLQPVGVSNSEAQVLADLIEEQSQQPLLVYQAEHSAPDADADADAEDAVVGAVGLHLVGAEPHLTPGNRHKVSSVSPVAAVSSVPDVNPPWELMVRLMGTVDVVDVRGEVARFERSKSLELMAWCVTHRGRSTRTAARTALWELNVRDATFANVVSEARRATSALVKTEQNRDWIRRTLTEELVLDAGITSDVEIMRMTLDRADQLGVAKVVPEMESALALIRGMPCEGSNYLWPEAEGISSDLILVATSLASSLALHRLAQGDVPGVFRATAAGLLALPGHEELIALRMRAHAAAGDLAGVKQEWVAYQRVIARDPWSGGEPAPKLRDLSVELLGMKV
jgi:hypothetical protein